MDCHKCVLVVLTLLQLCRAVLTDVIPGNWISANAISDGYSPKPLSEIFSSEPPQSFSPENPIVVLSSLSPEPEGQHYSSTPTTFSFFPTSTPSPSVTFPSSEAPSYPFSETFSTSSLSQLDFSKTPSIASQWPISTTPIPYLGTENPGQNLQDLETTRLHPQYSSSDLPNFSVIYENTPSSIPNIPSFQPHTSTVTDTPTVSTTTSTPFSSTITSVSEGTITPYILHGLSDATSRPTVTFRSTPPSTTSRTTIIGCRDTTNTVRSTQSSTTLTTLTFNRDTSATTKQLTPVTQNPLTIIPGAPDSPFEPKLRIRVVAPQGSITNVKINPTTTTKRPKTKKPKKNTYDGCLYGCRGRKDPICAVPLSSTIIDPDTLKGFPSVCHLACHNSFRKEAYEKLIDGRCGRLRTRIISVDSNNKMKREDLKKGEYSIINTGPQTVVEFARAKRG